MILTLPLLVGAALAVNACATLTEEECVTSDWRRLGEADGASGRQIGFVAEHQAACTKHGVSPDVAAWRAGWEAGIETYCTPSNGARLGAEGRSYAGSCPIDLKADFEPPYYANKKVYDARQQRDQLRSRIDGLRYELDGIKEEDKRREKRREMERLRDQLWDAEDDLERAEDDLRYERYADFLGR
ncbi:MAG TPA: DUF2799 domain-containing protein [Aurantimonas sp.]|jgi:hypothetical protein|nr:DUF2799 domain-containing protein [Aurantimonas sp.]